MSAHASILVTGGAGFIGSHLVEHLAGAGQTVRVLDNFRNGRQENLDPARTLGRVEVIHGDITDRDTCVAACRGVDTIYHLACLGVRHSLHNPIENHQVNALGTLYILEAARARGVSRFIYMSTSEVYGRAEEFPIRESTSTYPLTVYGASKLAGEHYARAYHECWGLSTVCVRPFNNYGPRSHFEGDAGEAIPRFILRALAGQPPVVFGDGSHTRDFLYVKDCARALEIIAATPSLTGQIVNLGYGTEMKIGRLARLAAEAAGRPDLQPQHVAPRPADVPRLWVDTSKLAQATGFHPTTAWEDGLRATVDYFRDLRLDASTLERLAPVENWNPPS